MVQVQDVPNDFFHHYPGMTQCGNCDELIPQSQAVAVTHDITETFRDIDHYCSASCAKAQLEAFHAYD